MRLFSLHSRRSTALSQGLAEPLASQHLSRRLGWLISLLLLFACADFALQWGMRLGSRAQSVPSGALRAGVSGVDARAARAAALFGSAPVRTVQAPARFRLYGVIGGGEQAGAALIGVDGAPARAWPVGAEIAPGVRLVSTAFGQARIEQQGRLSTLQTRPGDGGQPALRADAPAAPSTSPIEQRLHDLDAAHVGAPPLSDTTDAPAE